MAFKNVSCGGPSMYTYEGYSIPNIQTYVTFITPTLMLQQNQNEQISSILLHINHKNDWRTDTNKTQPYNEFQQR